MSVLDSWRQSVANAINWLLSVDKTILARLTAIERKQVATDQDILDVKAAYEANKAEVQADVASLQKKIADLAAEIAAGNVSSPLAASLVKEITDDTAALHDSLNPTPVVPATP